MRRSSILAVLFFCGSLAIGALLTGCAPDYADRNGVGQPCTSNSECPHSLICVASMCIEGDTFDAGISDTGLPPPPDGGRPDVREDLPPIPDGGVCRPLERMCHDQRTELVCREDGGGWVGRACPGDSTCFDGSCQFEPRECRPDARRCRGNQIEMCADGREWFVVEPCPPGYTCGGDRCVPGEVCYPGEMRCMGPEIQFCEGDGWVTIDVCPPDMMCMGGSCMGVEECEPGAQRCFGRDIQMCMDWGGWDYIDSCVGDEVCSNGRCVRERMANLTIEHFWVEPGGFQMGEWTFGDFGVFSSGNRSTQETICTVWLSWDPYPNFDQDMLVMDLWLEGMEPNMGIGYPIEIPLEVPPGMYWAYVECNLFEPNFDESTYDDNIYMSPEPIQVFDHRECYEDEFEWGPQPAPIGPGEYWLGLCDEMDEYTFWLDEPSVVAIDVWSETGQPFELSIYDYAGQWWWGEEVWGGTGFQIELPPGEYVIQLMSWEWPGFNYNLSLWYEGNGRQADLAAGFVEVWFEEPWPGGRGFTSHSVFNAGETWIQSSATGLVMSRDEVYQPEQDPIVSIWETRGLSPGEEDFVEYDFQIPPLEPGWWTFILVADIHNQIRERDERNNIAIGPTIQLGGGLECDDYLEPNNSVQQAIDLPPETFDDLMVCQNDQDNYRFCLDGGERLDVALFFEHRRGDIDINILDQWGNQINGSYGTSNSEYVSVRTNSPACYVAQVYLCCGGYANTYSMRVEINRDGEVCSVLEPNNTMSSAVPIWEGLERNDLAICPAGDQDWFFVETYPGQRLLVGAIGTSDQGGLAINAFRPDGTVIAATTGTNPTVSFVSQNTDIVFIMVESLEGWDRTPYRLFLQELQP